MQLNSTLRIANCLYAMSCTFVLINIGEYIEKVTPIRLENWT